MYMVVCLYIYLCVVMCVHECCIKAIHCNIFDNSVDERTWLAGENFYFVTEHTHTHTHAFMLPATKEVCR